MNAQLQSTTASNTDRIERTLVVDAPRERVWRALSNAEDFGTWFGANLKGQSFAPGQRVRVPMSGCGHENVFFDAVIDRMEPTSLFSWRWHPGAVDPAEDYAKEIPTLVTFTLADAPGGRTRVTVVESGFDRVPAHRRAAAFRMNSGGWDHQMGNLARHVAS
jgi:uncharacterized protein YndB with AHSA1/START domain